MLAVGSGDVLAVPCGVLQGVVSGALLGSYECPRPVWPVH
jgi:hypothetical protein